MDSTSTTTRHSRLGALAIVIAISALSGYLIYGTMAGWRAPPRLEPVGNFQPTVMADATVEAPTPPAAPPRAVPETLPSIELADRAGKKTQLTSFAGRPLLINFWATWCAPCRREIPLLNQLRAERQAQRLEVVGIAVDFREDVLEYVQKTRVDYPLLIGEEDGLAAADAFGVGLAFPVSVFVASNSAILAVKIGELHRNEAEFILDQIAAVDGGRLQAADARKLIVAKLAEFAQQRAKAPSAG
jgi:thiol-disulfide isomerase/thioredoxin